LIRVGTKFCRTAALIGPNLPTPALEVREFSKWAEYNNLNVFLKETDGVLSKICC